MASGRLVARVTVDLGWVPEGVGGAGLGQAQANIPGFGVGSTGAGTAVLAQTLRVLTAVGVPGGTAPTLANINTALTTAVGNLAAATGSPTITPAMVLQIQNWFTGSP